MPKNEANNRPEIENKTEGTISRRSVLKIGAAAGAAGVLAPSMLTSNEALGFQTIPEPGTCASTISPNHHPFVDEFTAPFPADDHPLSPPPSEFPNLGAGEARERPINAGPSLAGPLYIRTGSQTGPPYVPLRLLAHVHLGLQRSISSSNVSAKIRQAHHRAL